MAIKKFMSNRVKDLEIQFSPAYSHSDFHYVFPEYFFHSGKTFILVQSITVYFRSINRKGICDCWFSEEALTIREINILHLHLHAFLQNLDSYILRQNVRRKFSAADRFQLRFDYFHF